MRPAAEAADSRGGQGEGLGAIMHGAELQARVVRDKTHGSIGAVHHERVAVGASSLRVEHDAVPFSHELHGVDVANAMGVVPRPAVAVTETDEIRARGPGVEVHCNVVRHMLDVTEQLLVGEDVDCGLT